MFLKIFVLGPLANNTIIIGCEKEHAAAVIDPSFEAAEKILTYLKKKNLKLKAILLTHSHWDHIAGVKALKEKIDVSVYVHELDRENLEKPGSDGLVLMYDIEGVKADYLLKDQDMVQIGSIALKVLHTPGHTPGSVCYFAEKEKILFSGDTLFKGSMGAVHFPASSAKDMWQSLKKLSLLPPKTEVFPGHGRNTTIKQENWLSRAEELFS